MRPFKLLLLAQYNQAFLQLSLGRLGIEHMLTVTIGKQS